MKERIYKYDNIKALLIFLVVYGHLVFTFKNDDTDFIYRFIYMFHMPAFVFISGMFAKLNIKSVVKNIILYIIFQVLYLLVGMTNMELYSLDNISILYPYYLMWYIYCITIWTLTIPLLKSKSKFKTIIIIIILSLILSIISGYIKINNGYGEFMEYQRLISLYVFFILGYYFKANGKHKESYSKEHKIKVIAILLLLLTIFILFCKYMPSWVLLFNRVYLSNIEICIRIFQIIFSLLMIHILIVITPNKDIKYITLLGKNTIYVYLSHGFITLLIRNLNIPKDNSIILSIIMIFISIILCYVPILIVNYTKTFKKKLNK